MFAAFTTLRHRTTYLFHFQKSIIKATMSNGTARVYSCSTIGMSKLVGTHDGSFHCDEALACFIIRLTHKFSNAQIVRTRDPKVLKILDAVVDVGGEYDPSRGRYGHHQKGFGENFGHGFTTKLSSAGLVFKHYGVEIVAKELQLDKENPDVHRLFLDIYKNFIEEIDAIDDGVSQYEADRPPRYLNNTDLSSRVGRLSLDWIDPYQTPEAENKAFQSAMALVGREFLESIHLHAKSWLPAQSIIRQCLLARKDVDPRGEIIVVTRPCPVSGKLVVFIT